MNNQQGDKHGRKNKQQKKDVKKLPDNLGKCADCSEVKTCPLLGCSYGMRAIVCERLESDKAKVISDALEGCSPAMRAMYNRMKILTNTKDDEIDKTEDVTKEGIEPYLHRQ